MHEMSLMLNVLETVERSAREAGALSVDTIHLRIGEMTEVVPEALEFAFEALVVGTICEGAELDCAYVGCRSHCKSCGKDYDHDRFDLACPYCGSFKTELLAGRDLFIDSVEVQIPDEEDADFSKQWNGSVDQDGT